ncbi:MAG: hypothetical protein JKP98_00770 [Rhodobacteraceae bacterium]|nr:hypothetical protein [Paracoccaceae bacterium]
MQKTPGRIPPARDRDRWDHVGRAHLGLACARPIAYGAVMVDRLTLPRPTTGTCICAMARCCAVCCPKRPGISAGR